MKSHFGYLLNYIMMQVYKV
ncbi:hypothetical protein KUCAC02_008800 [Chaenocephalus aceratus]|uniref:Uncharacterized protein n=1 Tax=Chaenocephalus aceratus TaxID=36190 RepID=A0ACB9WSG1_CHAAC|nr:hypothetical protein KUCAC02_008800 [Chaenocephalus aceratus]